MRRLVLAAVVALVVTGTALADPLDPKVKIVPADQARAEATLLVRNDLGQAWKGGPSATPSSLKAPICPALRPDYSKLTLTGHAESIFDNGNGGVQVVSDVEVWKTAKQAKEHMDALLKGKLAECIKYSFLKSPGGSQLVLFRVKPTKVGTFGDVSVSYRAPVGYKVGKQTVIVTSDFVLLRKGRTEIYLNVTGPSTDDAQLTALEKRLARTLVGRVRG